MKLIKENGYSYKGFQLGQEVMVKDKKCKIIAFDLDGGEYPIAVNKYLNFTLSFRDKDISDAGCKNGVYIRDGSDEYAWVSLNMINKNITSTNVFTLFKVGQRVWDCLRGWGEIVEDRTQENNDLVYPIGVKFEKYTYMCRYTVKGQMNPAYNRTLFFEEIPIPESALKPKRWRANTGGEYYFINSGGSIDSVYEDGFAIDNNRYNCGNYFKTRKEAKESILYKAYQNMIQDCGGNIV